MGLEEVGLEGGSVQWLMMVEVVFRGGLVEARGVGALGVSACSFWLELSCSSFRWLIMPENVLVGSLGECMGESWAVSLTGNEGAGRGWIKDDMMGSRCARAAALKSGETGVSGD